MIYMRLTRLAGELTVDEALCPDLKEAAEVLPAMLVRLKPGWALMIEHEGDDLGEDLDP